jgi:hypothetical protein
MLNNTSIPSSNYCSLQPYVWIPIRRNRYPSTITWHQIKRQQQEYGKKEIEKSCVRKKKSIKSTFFNYRLSMASSVVLFFEYCLSICIYILIAYVKITWVDSDHNNKRNRSAPCDEIKRLISSYDIFFLWESSIKKNTWCTLFIFIMLKVISSTLKAIVTN